MLAAALALAGSPLPIDAQAAVSLMPVQGLRFGAIVPGLPSTISPLDGDRRAVWELVGSGSVTLLFHVPSTLGSHGDARLVLRFGPRDGLLTFPGSSRVMEFDPGLPLSLDIPPGSGGATIFLGGTVEPGNMQAPRTYQGAVTVQALPQGPGGGSTSGTVNP
jgi:hypothetical protein